MERGFLSLLLLAFPEQPLQASGGAAHTRIWLLLETRWFLTPLPLTWKIPPRSQGQTPRKSKAVICQDSAVIPCAAPTPSAVCPPHQSRPAPPAQMSVVYSYITEQLLMSLQLLGVPIPHLQEGPHRRILGTCRSPAGPRRSERSWLPRV